MCKFFAGVNFFGAKKNTTHGIKSYPVLLTPLKLSLFRPRVPGMEIALYLCVHVYRNKRRLDCPSLCVPHKTNKTRGIGNGK